MATPLDAERARLRAEGHTDAEISQILINRASGQAIGGTQPTGAGAPVQMPMSGVLGNASAVLSHVKGTIPAIKRDIANLFNRDASPNLRAKSAAALALVAVIIGALGFAIYQEWQQHIISNTAIAAANAQKARAEACIARYNALSYGSQSRESIAIAKAQIATDCMGDLPSDVLARLRAEDQRGGCPVGQHDVMGWCKPDKPAQ